MIKFFKPEDFDFEAEMLIKPEPVLDLLDELANRANRILEERGIKIYHLISGSWHDEEPKDWENADYLSIRLPALPMWKQKCEHEVVTTKTMSGEVQTGSGFMCSKCSAELKPLGWEVVNNK